MLALLVAGWLFLPGSALVWTLLVLLPAAALLGELSDPYPWRAMVVAERHPEPDTELHFGASLRWLIASPVFHHWHHAARPDAHGQNYAGQLPFLDKLFGTQHMPEGHLPDRYGVDASIPSGYLSQLLYPLKGDRSVRSSQAN